MILERSDLIQFIKNTEGMVTPKTVGGLYQRAEMLSRLPVPVQKWIVGRAGGESRDIAFVVEPYSLFLAYEIVDPSDAARQLPPGYELVPTAMFEGTEPRICGVVGAFNVHTSVFWGSRVEFSLIAEHTATGMLSWVICDYESNTISYDPGQGFSGSSVLRSVVTTSHSGEVIVDVKGESRPNRLACVADVKTASMRPLDQRLWLEGNLSVDYGGRLLDDGSVPFGLVFDPAEVEQALQVPLDALEVEANTFGGGHLAPAPFEACCFPYAQHFQTTSAPSESLITNRDELERAARARAADQK
jgi:hypothetical protein